MPTKYIDNYEIEFSAEPLEGSNQWAAYVAVYGPSANPMHRNNIMHKHRVAAEQQLPDEGSALAAAEAAVQDTVASLKGGQRTERDGSA